MAAMWLTSSLLIYLIIPQLTWVSVMKNGRSSALMGGQLESLVVGACIAPTDPVLAASVVRGRFAEQHVPPHLRDLLAAGERQFPLLNSSDGHDRVGRKRWSGLSIHSACTTPMQTG